MSTISWDVTRQVRSHEGKFLSLALVIRNSYLNKEELVDFYSKDAVNPLVRPALVLVTQNQTDTMYSNNMDSKINMPFINSMYVVAIFIIAIIISLVIVKKKQNKLGSKTTKHL